MKKVAMFIACVALVASLSSCKKDYVCKCTDSTDSADYQLGKVKKKDAEDACNTFNTLWALGGGSCKAEKK